ncbi:FAD dependent oxidoreductase [Myxococcus stipitatus DSM 14675]|uniref:FAD dependent oxidoreductase n=1 Tax=Myxococcus stipitatus (strain DSM 14675 / JCM 12634 / Mx s8) TaxID=1278073 RepID=L7U4J4_MYXSD|nr:FAD-dependent oxidoreductase [Myxococcus stipitatus]AGC43746.1 FAD dependent oxidoreductase [Myxococcus stipitatus DSM 14675]
MSTHDILVAGNGALGLATARALSLQDPELRIAVVGPVGRPAGASPAAGAMLGCYGEVTAPLLRTPAGRARHAQSVLAAKLWPAWLEGLNSQLPAHEQVHIHPGTIVFSNAKSGTIEDENFLAIQQAVRDEGEPHEELDPNQVPGLNPAEDCRPKRALFLPREGTVDASRLLRGLTRVLEQSPKVTLVDGAVKALDIHKGRVTGVRLEDGTTLSAPQVVLAMGVGTQAVLDELPELARRIPRIFCGGGTSLLLHVPRQTLRHVVRTPNRAFACGLHALPRADNQVYVGATNILSAKPLLRTTPADMYFVLECLLEQIDQDLCAAQLVTWQTGNRPVTVDTCPLIGPTSVEGLWLLTGTYRDGLFQSPLLGQHLARRMCRQPGLIQEDFLPERKPLSLYSLKEAREEALKHYVAMGWEHGIRLPKVGWHRSFPRFYQQLLDSLYAELGEEEFVLPPELLAIVESNRATMVPFFRNYYAEVRRAWA